MPRRIEFPDERRYVFERDSIAFPVLLDGKRVECLISGELLMQKFGAKAIGKEGLVPAFQEHRTEIEAIIRSHLEQGLVYQQGPIVLTTHYTRLTVRLDEELDQIPGAREQVEKTQRILAEIIGPNAGEILVAWSCQHPPGHRPAFLLSVTDHAYGQEFPLHVSPEVLEDFGLIRTELAQFWSSVLRYRSHLLLLKSG